jgi:DinB family protein
MKSLRDPETQKEIRERLQGIRPDSPRQWGRMTAHQMICHLTDSFLGVLGDRPLGPAPMPLPRKIVKFIALDLPVHWPHGVKTMPEIDQEAGGTRPVEFAADLEALRFQLDRFLANPRAIEPAHPIFGPMSQADWMRWAYLHMDHHLRQFGR